MSLEKKTFKPKLQIKNPLPMERINSDSNQQVINIFPEETKDIHSHVMSSISVVQCETNREQRSAEFPVLEYDILDLVEHCYYNPIIKAQRTNHILFCGKHSDEPKRYLLRLKVRTNNESSYSGDIFVGNQNELEILRYFFQECMCFTNKKSVRYTKILGKKLMCNFMTNGISQCTYLLNCDMF